jgi:hypothetical protein
MNSVLEMLFSILYMPTLGGGIVGLPVPIPPAETPAEIYAAAPEDCLFYMFSSGAGELNPDSTNQSEQFVAEPEIQEFRDSLFQFTDQLIPALAEDARQKNEAFVLETALLAMTQPWFICIEEPPTFSETTPSANLKASAAIQIEEERFNAWKEFLVEEVAENNANLEIEERMIDGIRVHCFQIAPSCPTIELAYLDGWLLATTGDQSMDDLINCFQNSAGEQPRPVWLQESLATVELPSRSTFSYLNVNMLRDAIQKTVELNGDWGIGVSPEDLLELQQILGLEDLDFICSASGLDETRYAERTVLQFNAPPSGLLAALTTDSLSVEELSFIPEEANIALAVKADFKKVLEAFLMIADCGAFGDFGYALPNIAQNSSDEEEEETLLQGGRIDIKPSDFLENIRMMMVMQWGVDPVEDVLPLLGDTVVFYDYPLGGSYPFFGSTIAFELLDEEKYLELQTTIIEGLRDVYPEYMSEMFQTIEVHGGPIYALQQIRGAGGGGFSFFIPTWQDVPLQPSWTVSDGRLFISISPEHIRDALYRINDFREPFNTDSLSSLIHDERGSPSIMIFYDGTRSIKKHYATVIQYSPWIEDYLKHQFDIESPPIQYPSVEMLQQYARPNLHTVRSEENRIILDTSKAFPMGMKDPVTVSAAVAFLIEILEREVEAASQP